MRKVVNVLLVLAVSTASLTSYGMNSADAVVDVDWLNLLRLGLRSARQRNEKRLVPLPPLGSRPMGKSHLQALAPELVEHISSYLKPKDRSNLALTSQLQRAQVQSTTTHLTIPLEDVTPERLQDVQTKFPKVKSLRVRCTFRSVCGGGITPEDIALLAETFPNIQALDLADTRITAEGVRILSQPGVFTSLKELHLNGNWRINDQGIDYLSRAPFAPKLELVNVIATGMTTGGIQELFPSSVFKQSIKIVVMTLQLS